MHILFYTQDLAHLHRFSTGLSVMLVTGGLYGFVRLLWDATKSLARYIAFIGDATPTPPRQEPPPVAQP
jgi:hypothetical protein